jgi:hypothetical protein
VKFTRTEFQRIDRLLATEDQWCQHAEAQNGNGFPCKSRNPKATRYSLVGALWVAVGFVLPRFLSLVGEVATAALSEPHGAQEYARRFGVAPTPSVVPWWAFRRLVNWEDAEATFGRVRKAIHRLPIELDWERTKPRTG